jgi:predicted exporter
MKLFKLYDDYLKGLAEGETRFSGMWRVHIVVLPFLLAILCVLGLFDALGWNGPVGFFSKIGLSVCLLIGLLYSGFRFVFFSNRRMSRQPQNG